MRKNGQILFMFLFMFMAMLSFVYLIINLGELSIAKIKLQKAVDSAALAMATYQARAFNSIADKNYILKYPSGDKKRRYETGDKKSYSMPGIDQVDRTTGFGFKYKSAYDFYFENMAKHQNQQDKFVKIYEKLIPKIAENFAAKNDKDAVLDDQQHSNFDFKRQYVDVKYSPTEDSKKLFSKYILINQKEGWMTHADKYIYSYVSLIKSVSFWGYNFELEAISLGEVVAKDGQVWPEPKPKYKAKLSPTQEQGVFH